MAFFVAETYIVVDRLICDLVLADRLEYLILHLVLSMNIFNDNVLLTAHLISYMWLEQVSNDLFALQY